MHVRRILCPVGIALAMSAALAACAGTPAAAPTPRAATSAVQASQAAIPPGKYDAAIYGIANPAPPNAQTVHVGMSTNCGNFAYALVVTPACADLQRTVLRSLTSYVVSAGYYGSAVYPDLASDYGISNDAGTSWTYTLRSGLHWSDGSPITAADAVRGIQGLRRAHPGLPITKVTIHGSTIVISTSRMVRNMDALLALPQAAARSTNALYSGPFMPAAVGSLHLVANPYWTVASDPIRRPAAAGLDVHVYSSDHQALAAQQRGDVDVLLGVPTDPAFTSWLLVDDARARHMDDPANGQVTLLAIMSHRGALASADCSHAMYSAVNRTAVAAAVGESAGQAQAGATVSTIVTAATTVGYDGGYQPYDWGNGLGDPVAARSSLASCGHPGGFAAALGYAATPVATQAAQAVIASLARVHIKLAAVPLAPAVYARRLAGPPAARGFDIALVSYTAPVSGVLGFWQPLSGTNVLGKPLPTNLAGLTQPTIAALLTSPEVASNNWQIQADVGRMIDRLVLSSGGYIPLTQSHSVEYRSPRLTNVVTQAGYANWYDVVDMGVRPSER